MTVTLAAMLGQIGLPGGGFGFAYGSMCGIGNPGAGMPGPSTIPAGKNETGSFIPVARISDMLLHPPEPEFYARLVVVGMFLAFGLVVARVLERHALAEARANALNRILRATEAVQQIVARQRDRRRLLAEACR